MVKGEIDWVTVSCYILVTTLRKSIFGLELDIQDYRVRICTVSTVRVHVPTG
jgi:hypothetical protein